MSERKDSPTRVGAIDVGSNALRFVAVEIIEGGGHRILDSDRIALRLGFDTFLTGHMRPATLDRAVEAVDHFRKRLDALQITRYRAVATSAVRQSRNGVAFVSRVEREVGLQIEIINGAEEARLVFQAVRRRVPLEEGDWILVDLGGGSLEVSLINRAGILWTESRSLGSVRLLAQLSDANNGDPARFRKILAEYVASLHFPRSVNRRAVAGFIATGGNIESLAKLADAEERWPGVASLPVDGLSEITERLARLTLNRRVEELGLRADRADVILPAAVVYGRLAEVAGISEIFVPFVGVKEGLVEDLITKIDGVKRSGAESHQDWDLAVNLGRKYHFEEPHALQVGRIALSLFQQLSEPLALDPDDQRFLAVAAILHDLGTVVSYSKHHKHSYYLIAQSELAGFTSREVRVMGLIARYHRKSAPSMNHAAFARLNDDEKTRVVRLAPILRLADALDRDHFQHVDEVRAVVQGGSLRLEVHGRGDLLLESWAIEKKSKLFARTFGMNVEMVRIT